MKALGTEADKEPLMMEPLRIRIKTEHLVVITEEPYLPTVLWDFL